MNVNYLNEYLILLRITYRRHVSVEGTEVWSKREKTPFFCICQRFDHIFSHYHGLKHVFLKK